MREPRTKEQRDEVMRRFASTCLDFQVSHMETGMAARKAADAFLAFGRAYSLVQAARG